MSDLFDEISSSELSEFRANFTEFIRGKKTDKSPKEPSASRNVKTRLLDLMLNPDASSMDEYFRQEVVKVIERISELNILDTPGIPAATSELLEVTLEYRTQILESLKNASFDEEKKYIWHKYIDQFFSNFILELVRRWENIEGERHLEQLEKAKTGQKQLEEENKRLRGIYALSIEIAKIGEPSEIYRYLSRKLPSIIPFDGLIICDATNRRIEENIYPVRRTSLSEINNARSRLEDLYELFHRVVIKRERVVIKIHNKENVDSEVEDVDPPESIFVPMIDEDYTWGMIGIFRRSGTPFNPQEVHALSIVTSLVDLVVLNIYSLKRERSLSVSHEYQMKFARSVQQNVLPTGYKNENISIATRFKPSQTLSGDFYQFFKTNKSDFGVVIGDVTGHGVAAGLMMMTVMGVLAEVFAAENLEVTEALRRANSNICKIVNEEFFVTALALWITNDNQLKFFNAGHPPGLLYQKSTEKIIELEPTDYPLGIFENLEIKTENTPL
ncbi:MAG: SpoIIE family protein phosphatase, partial [bacterium]